MKHVHESCSIECQGAKIISRDIRRSAYIEIAPIGKCTTYKCRLNSEALIVKELPHPKKPFYRSNSQVDIGTQLECETLFLAVNSFKSLKIEIINHSGRHKAQTTNTNSYTFAEIIKQIPNIPNVLTLPEVK